MLMVTHGGFDNSDINKDVNAMFPIDRLHELVEEGFIGSLSEERITFMGGDEIVENLSLYIHGDIFFVRLELIYALFFIFLNSVSTSSRVARFSEKALALPVQTP